MFSRISFVCCDASFSFSTSNFKFSADMERLELFVYESGTLEETNHFPVWRRKIVPVCVSLNGHLRFLRDVTTCRFPNRHVACHLTQPLRLLEVHSLPPVRGLSSTCH